MSKFKSLLIGKSTWVENLQQECNNQGYSNQKVDGYPGPNTLDGCH